MSAHKRLRERVDALETQVQQLTEIIKVQTLRQTFGHLGTHQQGFRGPSSDWPCTHPECGERHMDCETNPLLTCVMCLKHARCYGFGTTPTHVRNIPTEWKCDDCAGIYKPNADVVNTFNDTHFKPNPKRSRTKTHAKVHDILQPDIGRKHADDLDRLWMDQPIDQFLLPTGEGSHSHFWL